MKYREEETPMWELDDFFGLPHTTEEFISWDECDVELGIVPHTYDRDDEWKKNISISIKEWWEETNGGNRNRQYKVDGKTRVRPEDLETPQERSESRSRGMNQHWFLPTTL